MPIYYVELCIYLVIAITIPAQIILSILKRPWMGLILPIVLSIIYITTSIEYLFWPSIGLVVIYLVARANIFLINKLEKRRKRLNQDKLRIKDL
jgi:hypothetical protein